MQVLTYSLCFESPIVFTVRFHTIPRSMWPSCGHDLSRGPPLPKVVKVCDGLPCSFCRHAHFSVPLASSICLPEVFAVSVNKACSRNQDGLKSVTIPTHSSMFPAMRSQCPLGLLLAFMSLLTTCIRCMCHGGGMAGSTADDHAPGHDYHVCHSSV